jgi:hypothetical protein
MTRVIQQNEIVSFNGTEEPLDRLLKVMIRGVNEILHLEVALRTAEHAAEARHVVHRPLEIG